jgi:hypothetical protein
MGFSKKISSLGLKIQNTKEYLNANITNDEGFLKDGVSIFAAKVLAMKKQIRKKIRFSFSKSYK